MMPSYALRSCSRYNALRAALEWTDVHAAAPRPFAAAPAATAIAPCPDAETARPTHVKLPAEHLSHDT